MTEYLKPKDLEVLFKNVGGISEEEKNLTNAAWSADEHKRNWTRVVSQMYYIKHLEKHAKAMRNLTRALVGVALLQVIVAAIALYLNL